MNTIRRLLADETGATAIEYGLIVALLAVACITALQSLGNELSTTMNKIDTTLSDANT